jgi:hypothetical protein
MTDSNPWERHFHSTLFRGDPPPVSPRTPRIRATLDPLHLGRRQAAPARLDPAPTPQPLAPASKGTTAMPTLAARAIKVTLVLDPTEVFEVLQQTVAVADTRVPFEINVDGRRLRCTFATKGVRKALATLQHEGPGNIAVIIQGKLMRDDTIAEAGLMAQVKAPKPEPETPVAAA